MNVRSGVPVRSGSLPPIDALDVMGSLVLRMGEILGGGVIYRLVHFAAFREGERIATHYQTPDAAGAVQKVSDLLRLRVHVERDAPTATPGAFKMRVDAVPHLHIADRGVQGLVIGLLEGALTVTEHRKITLVEDPVANGGGLTFRMDG